MGETTSHTASEHDEAVVGKKETLLSHLNAMRKLLTKCAIAFIIGFAVSLYLLCSPILSFITKPIVDRGIVIIYTAVSEAFTTQLKISLVAGVVITSPYLFFEIWRFVKPALYDHEIRIFRVMFVLALILFLTGIFFCYNYVYELAINFFIVAGEGLATPMLSIDKYVAFLFSFILPFGVVFELPIAINMATRLGWTNYDKLKKSRKFVFFGIFVFAAVLTPPDVISQLMLALPMYVLFEISVQVSRLTKNRRIESDEGEGAEEA